MNSLLSIPEAINPLIAAHGPGIGIISISFFFASFTISSPGSDITGVPASDTNAIFFPSINLLINSSLFISSLCL